MLPQKKMMGKKLSINITLTSVLVTLLSVVFMSTTIALGHFVMVVVNHKSLNFQEWQLKSYLLEQETFAKRGDQNKEDMELNRRRQEDTRFILLKRCSELFVELPEGKKQRAVADLQARTGTSIGDFEQLFSGLLSSDWRSALEFVETTLKPLRPHADSQISFTIFCILAGLAFIYGAQFFNRDSVQSILGVIGGLFIWFFVEEMLIYAAQTMGIQRHGGTNPEYILLKFSAPFLVVAMIFFIFREGSRCNFAVWVRKTIPMVKSDHTNGNIYTYGTRTAYEYILITWFFYVVLLFAYDPEIFGLRSLFTYTLFFINISATLYLVYKLLGYKSVGANLRYAIPTTIILWNNIEILAKWRFFQEPWLRMNIPVMAMIGVGFAISGFFIIRDIRYREPL